MNPLLDQLTTSLNSLKIALIEAITQNKPTELLLDAASNVAIFIYTQMLHEKAFTPGSNFKVDVDATVEQWLQEEQKGIPEEKRVPLDSEQKQRATKRQLLEKTLQELSKHNTRPEPIYFAFSGAALQSAMLVSIKEKK